MSWIAGHGGHTSPAAVVVSPEAGVSPLPRRDWPPWRAWRPSCWTRAGTFPKGATWGSLACGNLQVTYEPGWSLLIHTCVGTEDPSVSVVQWDRQRVRGGGVRGQRSLSYHQISSSDNREILFIVDVSVFTLGHLESPIRWSRVSSQECMQRSAKLPGLAKRLRFFFPSHRDFLFFFKSWFSVKACELRQEGTESWKPLSL